MGSNPSLKQLALGRSCQPATFCKIATRFGRFESHATLKGKFGMRYLIFPPQKKKNKKKHTKIVLISPSVSGHNDVNISKKALPTSSNQQDHRIHGGSKNARLPHRSHWKCWRKGSPQRHRVKISRLSRLEVHPMPPKRFAKVIAPGDFFQPQ